MRRCCARFTRYAREASSVFEEASDTKSLETRLAVTDNGREFDPPSRDVG